MTPQFSQVVDLIVMSGLEIINRIERNEPIDVREAHRQIQNRINEGDTKFGESEVWNKAKYALVAWLDEQMIGAPWEGSKWWENNVLERKYFFDRRAYDYFFPQAEEAAKLPNKDALEVFYLCVILGFRGFYDRPNAAQTAEKHHLPLQIDQWVGRTARSLCFDEPSIVDTRTGYRRRCAATGRPQPTGRHEPDRDSLVDRSDRLFFYYF